MPDPILIAGPFSVIMDKRQESFDEMTLTLWIWD